MTQEFYNKYAKYDNFNTNDLIHIKEKSFYNHNYYIGLDNDIIYIVSDDCYMNDIYVIKDNKEIYIGYSYIDENIIYLSEEELS